MFYVCVCIVSEGLLGSQDREVSSLRNVIARRFGGPVLGVIRPMSYHSPVNLTADCRKHGRACGCWVTPRVSDWSARGVNNLKEAVLRDMSQWLLDASDCPDMAAHQRLSEKVREKYGHAPKAAKP